jgi:hypothetical protein
MPQHRSGGVEYVASGFQTTENAGEDALFLFGIDG